MERKFGVSSQKLRLALDFIRQLISVRQFWRRVRKIMRINGHKTRSMFDRYDISEERDIQLAGQKLANYLEEKARTTKHSSDGVLRAAVASKFPNAIVWKPVGLPADFLPLIAPERSAFVQPGERTVAHGGLTLEEVVVPFVRVIGDHA